MSDQEAICKKYNSPIVKCNSIKKIGVAISSLMNQPIRGKRYLPMEGTEGWFIWGGDNNNNDDFFQPIHVSYLQELFPMVSKYLALAPGFSFIIDEAGYEDVWFDEEQSKRMHDD